MRNPHNVFLIDCVLETNSFVLEPNWQCQKAYTFVSVFVTILWVKLAWPTELIC